MARPCPVHLPRHLLLAMLAYRLQANEHGDLSQEYKRYLNAVGRAATQNPKGAIPGFSPERRGFKPGTVLSASITVSSTGYYSLKEAKIVIEQWRKHYKHAS